MSTKKTLHWVKPTDNCPDRGMVGYLWELYLGNKEDKEARTRRGWFEIISPDEDHPDLTFYAAVYRMSKMGFLDELKQLWREEIIYEKTL